MADWPAVWKGVGFGTVAGMGVGMMGFFLAVSHVAGMGVVMFCLVPVAAGFAVGLVTPGPNKPIAAGLLAIIASLVILVALGREGVLCSLLASPLLAAGVFIGVLLALPFRPAADARRNHTTTTGMIIVIAPGLIFAAHQIERPYLDRARIEIVSTTVRIADTPEHTWLQLQSIDSIQASKPWLMYFGLPVPLSCRLDRTEVGARRTCYFNNGYIEETVTVWDPPHSLGLRIDRTHMSGRHWLGFVDARYQLQPDGDGTLVTRTTTISSHLYPAWYWRPLERLGVASEHKYLLQEVANRAGTGRLK
jgi:hypothetical protein